MEPLEEPPLEEQQEQIRELNKRLGLPPDTLMTYTPPAPYNANLGCNLSGWLEETTNSSPEKPLSD